MRQGYWSTALAQAACLPALGLALWSIFSRGLAREARLPVLVLAAGCALPLLQLLPLPPAVWANLPGRESLAEGYRLAGMSVPWQPVSLDPYATLRSALALIPGAALFLAALALDERSRERLAGLLLLLAGVNAVLGLAQLAAGPGALHPYSLTNPDDPVGVFANRNHFAALLYAAVPFAAAAAAARKAPRPALVLLALLLLTGTVLSGSRAAALLALAATAGATTLVVRRPLGRRLFAAAFALGAGLGLLLLLPPLLPGDAGARLLDDERRTLAAGTLRAGVPFQPIGAGFGTFQPVYRLHEQPGALRSGFANRAHNDWLELWLEGGAPFLMVAAAFLVSFGALCARRWRDSRADVSSAMALRGAAALVVLLLLAHSAVDYPLRTPALMALFGFACALLVPVGGRDQNSAVS